MMEKEDWIRKLTSRKFWAAVAGFVTGLIVFLKAPTSDASAITALIMSLGTLIAYILGEGLIDASAARGVMTVTHLSGDDLSLNESPDTHPPEA